MFWTDTADFGEVRRVGTVDEQAYSGPGAVGIAESLRAAGRDPTATRADLTNPLAGRLGVILGLAFLGVLVIGPAPALGTRWFWWWVVVLTPYGLGLLFWLARDRPWARPAEPAGPRARDRGLLGLITGFLAAIVINVLLLLLTGVLGDRWVPMSG